MAAKGVWGVDVGEAALKAVHAVTAGERIAVTAFDVVEYKQVLSAPGVDRDEVLKQALRTFLSRNALGKEKLLICMPGHTALIKFVKLPPVDRNTIPDVVQYEASVQIPFPLEEVAWDYHPIDRGFVPGEQVEVGLFAMRRELIQGFLDTLSLEGVEPDVVQVVPPALYNYIQYDYPPVSTANVIMDIGCSNTVLVVLSQDTIWTRNLPMGGNDFTTALAGEFHVSFGEAEILKRQLAGSAQAKQAASALEPVLARLVDEVEKSLGYYRSLHPDVLVESICALGGGFKLPGLAKYLSENINIPVRTLTEPQNFDVTGAKNTALFKRYALSFAPALGLAVQGLGKGRCFEVSLLPAEALTGKILARKKPYAFAALALVLLIAGVSYLKVAKTYALLGKAAPNQQRLESMITELNTRKTTFEKVKDVSQQNKQLAELLDATEERGVWSEILKRVTRPIKAESENDLIWLISIDSELVRDTEAADEVAGESGMEPFGEPGARPALVREPIAGRGGPQASAAVSERGKERFIPKVTIRGELNPFALPDFKTPRLGTTFDGSIYVATQYKDKLAQDPWFYGVRTLSTKQQVHFLNKDGKQIPRDQAIDTTGVPLPGIREVEFTEFTIELYVDWTGKLKGLVEETLKAEAAQP